MCLIFSCYSFGFWLSDFQSEYLGTDIFILFYAQGVVCIISGPINLYFYDKCGMKLIVIIFSVMQILAAIIMVLIQRHIIKFEDEQQ